MARLIRSAGPPAGEDARIRAEFYTHTHTRARARTYVRTYTYQTRVVAERCKMNFYGGPVGPSALMWVYPGVLGTRGRLLPRAC